MCVGSKNTHPTSSTLLLCGTPAGFSDISNRVRREAVRSLSNVYHQPDFISSLNTFTECFRSQLIKMTTFDVDVSIRIAIVHVLASMDGYSLFEDEENLYLIKSPG